MAFLSNQNMWCKLCLWWINVMYPFCLMCNYKLIFCKPNCNLTTIFSWTFLILKPHFLNGLTKKHYSYLRVTLNIKWRSVSKPVRENQNNHQTIWDLRGETSRGSIYFWGTLILTMLCEFFLVSQKTHLL